MSNAIADEILQFKNQRAALRTEALEHHRKAEDCNARAMLLDDVVTRLEAVVGKEQPKGATTGGPRQGPGVVEAAIREALSDGPLTEEAMLNRLPSTIKKRSAKAALTRMVTSRAVLQTDNKYHLPRAAAAEAAH